MHYAKKNTKDYLLLPKRSINNINKNLDHTLYNPSYSPNAHMNIHFLLPLKTQ